MGLLLLGIGTYVGIIACVWMVSSAFAEGGILGVVGIFAWLGVCVWIANKSSDDKKK